MADLWEEFIQFLMIWLASFFITGIFLNNLVVSSFGGQWIESGLFFAVGFYILFKGLLSLTHKG